MPLLLLSRGDPLLGVVSSRDSPWRKLGWMHFFLSNQGRHTTCCGDPHVESIWQRRPPARGFESASHGTEVSSYISVLENFDWLEQRQD